MGQTYKKLQQPDKAMKCLNKALALLKKTKKKNAGLTYLNICTIYSLQNEHQKALKYVNKAAYYLKKELEQAESIASGVDASQRQKFNVVEFTRLLAIAYYNKGIEAGFIGDKQQQVKSYKEAYKILSTKIGPKDNLAMRFKRAYKKLKQKLKVKNQFMNRPGSATVKLQREQ